MNFSHDTVTGCLIKFSPFLSLKTIRIPLSSNLKANRVSYFDQFHFLFDCFQSTLPFNSN